MAVPLDINIHDLRWSKSPATTLEEAVRRYNAHDQLQRDRAELLTALRDFCTARTELPWNCQAMIDAANTLTASLRRLDREALTGKRDE